MGVGSASVVDYANTYPGTASHVNATGSVGDFEVVVDGSGATTLSLNFQTATSLDPRITFSRTSNATVVGPDGLIQYAPHNLLTYSEQFDNAAWVKTTTTVVANSIISPDGTTTADTITATGADSSIRESVSGISAGVTYTFSVYLKSDVPTSLSIYVVDSGGGSGNTSQTVNVTNQWQRFNVIRTTSALTTSVSCQIGGATSFSTGESVYAWGAQLNEGALQPYYTTTVKNLLGYSQNFENVAWTKINSIIASSTVIGPFGFDGGQKLVENTAAGTHSTLEGYSFATTTYTYSVYVKAGERTKVRFVAATGSGGVLVDVNLITGSVSASSSFGTGFAVVGATVTSIGTGWYRAGLIFSSTAGSGSVQAILLDASGSNSYTGDGTSGIYIFGAQLSDSASLDPYSYNPVAAPTSTAYYGPRFDYDPATLAPKGLLLEEQRTNLLTYSSEFDNAVWSKISVTASPNITIAPDGTSTADALIATTINAEHVIDELFSVIAGTTYTMSGYVKAAGLTSIGLRFTIASLWPLGGSPQVSFNLVTKTMTVISGQPSAYTITEVNNGWFRIAMSVTCAVSGIASARFQLMSGLSNVFLGDGSSGNYIWGTQLEAGAFPTSHIPTTSATVTRAADNASMVGSNFSSWYNQSEGTFVVSAIGSTTSGIIFSVNDGTNAERIQLGLGSGSGGNINLTVTDNNILQAQPLIGSITASNLNKSAGAYTLNDFAISANGVTPATDTLGTIPTPTQATIGMSGLGAVLLNGHIQSIKYYPTRLPNGTLQGLTA